MAPYPISAQPCPRDAVGVRSPCLSLCGLNRPWLCTVRSLCPGWPLSIYIVPWLQSCLFSLPSLFLTIFGEHNWKRWPQPKEFFFPARARRRPFSLFFLLVFIKTSYLCFHGGGLLFLVTLLILEPLLLHLYLFVFLLQGLGSNMFSESRSAWAISGLVIMSLPFGFH